MSRTIGDARTGKPLVKVTCRGFVNLSVVNGRSGVYLTAGEAIELAQALMELAPQADVQ